MSRVSELWFGADDPPAERERRLREAMQSDRIAAERRKAKGKPKRDTYRTPTMENRRP